MKKISTLRDAIILKLKSLYDVEMELAKSLYDMEDKAIDPELKKGFRDHLEETKGHLKRLEEMFTQLDVRPEKMKVEGVRGLMKDTEWVLEKNPEKKVLDSLLISSASYAEHYEMAGYITAYRWATKLGLSDVANLLQMTLKEEEVAAQKLESLAEELIDDGAM